MVAIEDNPANNRREENRQNTRITANPRGKPPNPARVVVKPKPGSMTMPALAAARSGSKINLKLIVRNKPATARMIRRLSQGEIFQKTVMPRSSKRVQSPFAAARPAGHQPANEPARN